MNFTSQKSCDIIVLEEGYAAWPQRGGERGGEGEIEGIELQELNCSKKPSDITVIFDCLEHSALSKNLVLEFIYSGTLMLAMTIQPFHLAHGGESNKRLQK